MAEKPQRLCKEGEQRRERAGLGLARKFSREGKPLRVSGGFSLLKALRLEPVLGSWPGTDLISARLANTSREHNALCRGMHAAAFGSAQWVGAWSRSRSRRLRQARGQSRKREL